MDEKELRDKEELKRQIRELTPGKKVEYFLNYYKWVLVILGAAILVTIGGVQWAKGLKDVTILGVMSLNSYFSQEDAADQIKETLGSDDSHENVEIFGTVSVDPETGKMDYYGQMAFTAMYAAGSVDMIFLPEFALESVLDQVFFAEPEDSFGEEAEKYRPYYSDGYYTLPDPAKAQTLLGLSYEPVHVILLKDSKNMDNAAEWLKSFL